MYPSYLLAVGLALTPLVSAHCKITTAKGDLGGAGQGLGITANSANSESDVTVFNSGKFGETPGGGAIDEATALTAQLKITGNTLPQVSADSGVVTMNLHQVNADGAGPMTCSVSADATGNNFTAMKVTTNVAGTNGKSTAANADFPLVADMPAGTVCTGTVGGIKNVCAVKCANPVGPFGGTVLVQQAAGAAGAASSASSDSTASSANTASTASAAAKGSKAKKSGKAKKSKSKSACGGSVAARANQVVSS